MRGHERSTFNVVNIRHELRSKMGGLQLELDENGSASQTAELYRNIVEPILGIPVRPPLDRNPQSVFPFSILYPPLLQCGS